MGRQPLQSHRDAAARRIGIARSDLRTLPRFGSMAGMHELVRTNDLILLGALEALLSAADLECLIADQHVSALEGMIGAFPRRLLVREQDRKRARALLIEAGYGDELRDE